MGVDVVIVASLESRSSVKVSRSMGFLRINRLTTINTNKHIIFEATDFRMKELVH